MKKLLLKKSRSFKFLIFKFIYFMLCLFILKFGLSYIEIFNFKMKPLYSICIITGLSLIILIASVIKNIKNHKKMTGEHYG